MKRRRVRVLPESACPAGSRVRNCPKTFSLLASSGTNMKDLIHVAVGGGCRVRRTAAVLTRAQVRRVPVPPVMFRVRLLVVVVVLRRFAEELYKSHDVHGSCSLLLPFAAGKTRRDLLEQPAVPSGSSNEANEK